MEKGTEGAWVLSQSKNLDSVRGAGAARLENIAYAGKIGRLYNLLRRNVPNEPTSTIDRETVDRACQLNDIDRSTRDRGLDLLAAAGRIDIATNGSIAVLGATSLAVLEVTSELRSEERRVGKECVSTCRSRWSPNL